MKTENTLFKDLKRMLLLPLTDFPLFFSKKFYTENWDKHFGGTGMIMLLIMTLLLIFTDIQQANFYFAGIMWHTQYLFQLFIAYLLGFAVNFLREWFFSVKTGSPFSLEDCRYGAYGAVFSRLVLTVLIYVFEAILKTIIF